MLVRAFVYKGVWGGIRIGVLGVFWAVFVVFVCLQRCLEGGIRIGSSGAYLRCFRGVLGGVFEVFFSQLGRSS